MVGFDKGCRLWACLCHQAHNYHLAESPVVWVTACSLGDNGSGLYGHEKADGWRMVNV